MQVSEETGSIGQASARLGVKYVLTCAGSVLDIERSRQEDALAARLAG
jgi:hypothetical protein